VALLVVVVGEPSVDRGLADPHPETSTTASAARATTGTALVPRRPRPDQGLRLARRDGRASRIDAEASAAFVNVG
jgi:hypothetical protein